MNTSTYSESDFDQLFTKSSPIGVKKIILLKKSEIILQLINRKISDFFKQQDDFFFVFYIHDHRIVDLIFI